MSVCARESCVLQVCVDTAWAFLRPFDFAFMPGIVESIVAEDPDHHQLGEVGSVCNAAYANGDTERIRITEMSERDHRLSYELLSSEPAKLAQGVSTTMQLRPITDRNYSYFEVRTTFSEDIPLQKFIEHKLKLKTLFAALKRGILSGDDQAEWYCHFCTLLNPPGTLSCKACNKKNLAKFQFHTVKLHYPTAKLHRTYQSETFTLFDRSWQVLMFPTGNNSGHAFGAYLQLMGLQEGEELCFEFVLEVLHPPEIATPPQEHKESVQLDSEHVFTRAENDRGFKCLLELDKVAWFLDEMEELHIQVSVCQKPLPQAPLQMA